MNLEQAKAKLADLSHSTGIKHPKVLISELCVVISFLLDEIDKIKTPPFSVLKNRLPEDADATNQPSVKPPWKQWPDQPKPQFPSQTPDILPPTKRRGNAGDAE